MLRESQHGVSNPHEVQNPIRCTNTKIPPLSDDVIYM